MTTDLVPTNGGTPAVPDRDPWEKQKGESAKAFAAFAIYRDLGPNRSLQKASQAIAETAPRRKVETILQQLKEWSAKYGWVDRCDAYDVYVDRRFREAKESAAERMARLHGGLASLGTAQLAVRLRGGEGRDGQRVEALDPNSIESFGELASALEKFVKIERLSAGQPTDFLRGGLTLTAADFEKFASRIVDLSLSYIPEERREQYLLAVESLAGEGG